MGKIKCSCMNHEKTKLDDQHSGNTNACLYHSTMKKTLK